MGSSLFWYENWTGLGALYFLINPDFAIDGSINNVCEVVVEDSWDVDKLLQILPEEYVVHIVEKIKPSTTQDALDKPFWRLESRGNFTVSSAWNYLRRRQDQRNAFNKMWVKGMPFKISFFLWKVWKALGWIKVNTDGASRGNPGRSSIGFVLRNEEGNVVYARGKEIPETTNNEAEAWAILEGLSYCVNQQYIQILIQTDSMLLKNVLDEVWIAPWNVTEIVEEINKLRHRCTVTFTHILREGNRLVDYLANYALDFGNIEAAGFTDLDTHGKKIVNNEKMQCPYLRVKPKRN
ncbi:uncharacterized protein [Nicotiana tomentosiformis]|uniref:uncharacterized protein n=1 Tax=Nicotiana tomentosiformis TaxID=4098 RepID=UPI00388CE9A2